METQPTVDEQLRYAKEHLHKTFNIPSFYYPSLESDYLAFREQQDPHHNKVLLIASIVLGIVLCTFTFFFLSKSAASGDKAIFITNLIAYIAVIGAGGFCIKNIKKEKQLQIALMTLSIIFLSISSSTAYFVENFAFRVSAIYLSFLFLILSPFFTQLRTPFAGIMYAAVPLVAFFAIFVYARNDFAFSHLFYSTLLTSAIAMAIAVLLENSQRKLFLKNTIIDGQQSKIDSLNRRYLNLHRRDSLTGTYNLRHFYTEIHEKWKRAQNKSEQLSLILLEIDFFKEYKLHYGHQMSEKCVQDIAIAIRSVARRPTDLIARYNKKTFAILLTEAADADSATNMAKKIKASIEKAAIENIQAKNTNIVTVSAGVTTLSTTAPRNTPERLIKLTEDSLYEAKTSGKNKVSSTDKKVAYLKFVQQPSSND